VIFKIIGRATAIILVATCFVALGLWQLDRAQDMQAAKKVVADTTIYPLSDLAAPATALDSRSVGKIVQLRGNYILTFRAPFQNDVDKKRDDWEVALMQVDQNSAILVLRGLWSERLTQPTTAMSTGVNLVATVAPRQFEDRVRSAPGVLSRIDSSVIVGQVDLDLYDGFLVATSESVAEGVIERSRITPPKLESKVAGYYWQHISYVIIWWLMAAIVVILPFYRKRQESDTV
jgi:cytochrome oxidase assembly protein ShyY1